MYIVIQLAEKRWGIGKKVISSWKLIATCTKEQHAKEIVEGLNKDAK